MTLMRGATKKHGHATCAATIGGQATGRKDAEAPTQRTYGKPVLPRHDVRSLSRASD